MSRSNSAKLLPAVIVEITLAASCASHSKLFGSRFKDGHPRTFDACFQIGITHGTWFYEIDRVTKESFERIFKPEVDLERERVRMPWIELDQKIEIAVFGVKVPTRGRAKKLESSNVKVPAQRL